MGSLCDVRRRKKGKNKELWDDEEFEYRTPESLTKNQKGGFEKASKKYKSTRPRIISLSFLCGREKNAHAIVSYPFRIRTSRMLLSDLRIN